MTKIRGRATLPLVLQWRGASSAAPSSSLPPSLERKCINMGREILGRRIEHVEIERWGDDEEFGVIQLGKTHEKSCTHIPSATWQMICGCEDFGKYKSNFSAQSPFSPGSLIWSGPKHDRMVGTQCGKEMLNRLGEWGPPSSDLDHRLENDQVAEGPSLANKGAG